MLGLGRKRSVNDGRKEPLIDEKKKVEANSTGEFKRGRDDSAIIVQSMSSASHEPETFSPPFVRRGLEPTNEQTSPQGPAAKPEGGSSTETLPNLPAHDECRSQGEQSDPSRRANPEAAAQAWETLFGARNESTSSQDNANVDIPDKVSSALEETMPQGDDSSTQSSKAAPAPVQGFWETLFGSPVAPASSQENGNESTPDKDSPVTSAYQPPDVVNRKKLSPLETVEEDSASSKIPGDGDILAGNEALSRSALEGFQPERTGPDHLVTQPDGQIPSKVPSTDGWSGFFRRVQIYFAGPILLVPIFLFIAAGMILGASKEFGYEFNLSHFFEDIDWDEEMNVAFIGNAYLYVNDVPRVVQALSDDLIYQDSVIHPGGSLGSLLRTGNGMYKAWRTEEADIGGKYYENYGGYKSMYDYGACTVRFSTFLVFLSVTLADLVVYAVIFVARWSCRCR
jgi:hypothetical protein